jgi:hypothetical protein
MFGRLKQDSIAPRRESEGSKSTGADLDRKFWVALGLYAVLAAVVWLTMDSSKAMVGGKAVDLRLIPLLILGGLALKTVLARQADKIRRGR